MHVHFLDPYRPRPSVVHALDARVKFPLAVGFILATALMPQGAWAAYVLLLAVVLSVEVLAELGVGYVWKRAALALPFVLAALPVMFTLPGEPLLRLTIGAWTPTISVQGLERFLSIAAKSWLSVQMAVVLAAATRFPELLGAMRSVRIPRLLVAIIGLMWRYLFVLVDEALRLMRAREARSGHAGQAHARPGGTLVWRARVTGGMAGSLFLRSFDRAERIYAAMASRGYDGEVRLLPAPPVPLGQQLILAGSLVLLAMLVLLGYSI